MKTTVLAFFARAIAEKGQIEKAMGVENSALSNSEHYSSPSASRFTLLNSAAKDGFTSLAAPLLPSSPLPFSFTPRYANRTLDSSA